MELVGARLVLGHFAVGKQDGSAWRRQIGPGAAKHGDGNVQLPFTVKTILRFCECFCSLCNSGRSVSNYVRLPPALCIPKRSPIHRPRSQ